MFHVNLMGIFFQSLELSDLIIYLKVDNRHFSILTVQKYGKNYLYLNIQSFTLI